MSKGTVYEVIMTTWLDGKPYAAPIGIRVVDSNGALVAKIFRGGRLWQACSRSKFFALNVCLDPKIFVESIFHKDSIDYGTSDLLRVPIVNGCEGYLECVKLGSVYLGDYQLLYLQVVNERVFGLRPYSRGLGLSIELLIDLTRVRVGIKSCRDLEVVAKFVLGRLERVAPPSLIDSLREMVKVMCGSN